MNGLTLLALLATAAGSSWLTRRAVLAEIDAETFADERMRQLLGADHGPVIRGLYGIDGGAS